MALTFYDAFCGIGGFRIPLEELGWKCLGGCDNDPHARAVYKERFSEFPSGMDIREIDPREIPDHEMFCGGFPCPTWSIAGKRLGFKDPRGELVNEIFRIVREKRPRLLFLENVKGLLSHDRGRSFAVILAALDELGYDVQWQVLNSKNHGVPQNRERIFLIGNLGGTPRPEVFPLGHGGEVNESSRGKAQGDGSRVPAQIAGAIDKHYYKAAQGTRTLITSPKMKKLGNIAGTDHDSIWGRVYDKSGISQTINAKGGGMGAKTGLIIDEKEDSGIMGHVVFDEINKSHFTSEKLKNKRVRKLTPLECERLQGFPDNWTKIMYKGKPMSDQKRYECCGNAVTVNVIRDIVAHLA